MKKPILVIMAAGMASRYGGSKQTDGVGPNGEALMDYSVYDAIKAGFERVVIIIKKEFEEQFKQAVGDRISKHVDLKYAYQDINDIPKGYEIPKGRVKPWGTCHAIFSARALIDAPFVVINADDYYGPDAFIKIYEFLISCKDESKNDYAMVGYYLANTLSDNGTVSRGVCSVDEAGNLKSVVERLKIAKHGVAARYTEDNGDTWTEIDVNSTVSMNLFGFTQNFIKELGDYFPNFLDEALKTNPLKGEYLLPKFVGQLVDEKKAMVKVLRSDDKWYGMTYKEDKDIVINAMLEKHKAGQYKTPLWRNI
jgi:NDP-sugar pyrophosphorylase family protein